MRGGNATLGSVPGRGAPRVSCCAHATCVTREFESTSLTTHRAAARSCSTRAMLCAGMDCPSVGKDGLPLYIDSNHLRASFAREHAAFLDETLLAPKAR